MIRLDPTERAILLVRRHPVAALGGAALRSSIGVIGAIALLAWGGATNELVVPLALLFLLIAGGAFTIEWYRWWRDIVIVTDRRLVHRWGIIIRRSSETAVERIGDVRIEQGVLGRLYDYGDVEIVAGSDLGVDRLSSIRSPERLAAALREARGR
jgi:uncharacterized membrane protein YdbT with pleckstrin-like domain